MHCITMEELLPGTKGISVSFHSSRLDRWSVSLTSRAPMGLLRTTKTTGSTAALAIHSDNGSRPRHCFYVHCSTVWRLKE